MAKQHTSIAHSAKARNIANELHSERINSKAWYGMHWIRDNKRKAVYKRDNGCCVYCGISFEKTKRQGIPMTLDHVHPRELGGSNQINNLVTACLVCNCAKQHKGLRGFLKYLRSIDVVTTGIARRVRNQLSKSVIVCSPGGRKTKLKPISGKVVRINMRN